MPTIDITAAAVSGVLAIAMAPEARRIARGPDPARVQGNVADCLVWALAAFITIPMALACLLFAGELHHRLITALALGGIGALALTGVFRWIRAGVLRGVQVVRRRPGNAVRDGEGEP